MEVGVPLISPNEADYALFSVLMNDATILHGFVLLKDRIARDPSWLSHCCFEWKTFPDAIVRMATASDRSFPYSKLSFLDALMVGLSNKSHFYSAPVIESLLSLNASIFSLKDNYGKWWLWNELAHDVAQKSPHKSVKDSCLATILESLPDAAFEDNHVAQAWGCLLAAGVPGGLAQKTFMKRRPSSRMSALDESGYPYIGKLNQGETWTAFLDQGEDPWQVVDDKGTPFWRSLMPSKSSRCFRAKTLLSAVNEWMRKERLSPEKDKSLNVNELLESYASARALSYRWSMLPVEKRKVILEDFSEGKGLFIPREKSWRKQDGSLEWEMFFYDQNGQEALFWSNAIMSNKSWRDQVEKIPLAQAMVWLVRAMHDESVRNVLPEAVGAALKRPAIVSDIHLLTRLWSHKFHESFKRVLDHACLASQLMDVTLAPHVKNRL